MVEGKLLFLFVTEISPTRWLMMIMYVFSWTKGNIQYWAALLEITWPSVGLHALLRDVSHALPTSAPEIEALSSQDQLNALYVGVCGRWKGFKWKENLLRGVRSWINASLMMQLVVQESLDAIIVSGLCFCWVCLFISYWILILFHFNIKLVKQI